MSKPCTARPPDRRVVPAVAASYTGALNPDAVSEILLRLPAKELCRFCAVCRYWWSLLSDPQFVASHSVRHPGPLIVAGYDTATRDNGTLFDIMDLSGQVVKRVRSTGDSGQERVVSIQPHLVCVAYWSGLSCKFINPATGSICALPKGFAVESKTSCFDYPQALVAFGRVGSMGCYKVLRQVSYLYGVDPMSMVYEVCTLDGSSHTGWRRKKAPTYNCCLSHVTSAVVDGKVYSSSPLDLHEKDRIAYFDLETDEWSKTIRGPLSSLVHDAAGLPNNYSEWGTLSLAQLSGCLVMVHCTVSSQLGLWFLVDFEKGLWVKQYSFEVQLSDLCYEYFIRPLLVLSDGRLVTCINPRGALRTYNLRTSTYTYVEKLEMNLCVAVGLYTESLLKLAGSVN